MKILFFSFKLNLDLDIYAVIFGIKKIFIFCEIAFANKKIPEKNIFVK